MATRELEEDSKMRCFRGLLCCETLEDKLNSKETNDIKLLKITAIK